MMNEYNKKKDVKSHLDIHIQCIIKEHCITSHSKSIHDKLYPLFYEKL